MSIKVGISMRVVSEHRYKEERDSISHDWINFFMENKIQFVLIPNYGKNVINFLKKANLNVIILSNGNDIIHENLNKKENDSSPLRDLTEKLIIEYSLKNKIKILGVCRGAQLLNIYFGGKLVYKQTSSHVSKVFEKKIIDERFAEYFKKKSIMTNCFHRYFIEINNLAEDLIPFAISEDINIEGFYSSKKKILGIQWHPEREFMENYLSKKIVIDFIKNKSFFV